MITKKMIQLIRDLADEMEQNLTQSESDKIISLAEKKKAQIKEENEAEENETEEGSDSEEEEVDLETLSIQELRKMCKAQGLACTGKKVDLIARLEELDSEDSEEDTSIEEDVEDLENDEEEDGAEDEISTHEKVINATQDLTDEELKDLLKEHGASTKGKRSALISKIVDLVDDGQIDLDEEEDEEGMSLEDLLASLDKADLVKLAKELKVKVGAKDKVEAIIEKILNKDEEAINEALVKLELVGSDEEDSEDDEEDEDTEEDDSDDEEDEEDEEEEDSEEETDFTEEKEEGMEKVEADIRKKYKAKKLTDKQIAKFLKDYSNDTFEGDKKESLEEYITIHRALVDDEGDLSELESPYEVNEEFYCCGKKLSEVDGEPYCEICGQTYEA